MKYDYTQKKAIPIDLEGMEIKAQIYKPIEVVFHAKNKFTGEEKIINIPLTAKQDIHFKSLKSEEEKQRFMQEVIAKSKEVKAFFKEIAERDTRD